MSLLCRITLQELLCQSDAESAEDGAVFTWNSAELAAGFLFLGSPAVIPLFLLRSPTVWTWYEDSAHLDEVNGAHICVLLTSGPGGNPWVQMHGKHAAWHEHRHSCQEKSSFLTKKQITGRTLLMRSTAGGQTGKARAVPTAGSDKHHGSTQHGIQRCLRGKSAPWGLSRPMQSMNKAEAGSQSP